MDLIERFEAERCSGRKNYNLRAMLARCQAEAGCGVDLTGSVAEITADVISRTAAAMRQEGRPASTVRGYLTHLRAAFQFACELGIIDSVPVMRLPKANRRGRDKMRSFPITGEEFDRLQAAAAKVKRNPEPWVRLLNVLYWGGLRIGEAAVLTLEWGGDFQLDLEHRPPIFNIAAEGQKARRCEQVPVAPQLVEYLQDLPTLPRQGRLLRGLPRRVDSLVKGVAAIGKRSGIVVSAGGKTVTAHDLRRSFATRWAQHLKPAELCTLMRHRDIATTMDYYVHLDVQSLSDRLGQVAQGNQPERIKAK